MALAMALVALEGHSSLPPCLGSSVWTSLCWWDRTFHYSSDHAKRHPNPIILWIALVLQEFHLLLASLRGLVLAIPMLTVSVSGWYAAKVGLVSEVLVRSTTWATALKKVGVMAAMVMTA